MIDKIPDLAIIGAGPAALSAAIYAARAGLVVQVFERKNIGGLLSEIPSLENYPGYKGSGESLAQQMRTQAEQLSVQFSYGECTGMHLQKSGFELIVDEEPVSARSVLVATGSNPRRLSFTINRPTSYCALCDGTLAKGQRVAVVGGANSATISALYLAGLAEHVTLITHSRLKSDAILAAQLRQTPNISIIENTEPTPALLEPFDYIFVYIGHTPATGFLSTLSSDFPRLLNPAGYINTLTSTAESRHLGAAFSYATIMPGLFAAGDVRNGAVRQVVTAAADGAAAAIEIANFLRSKASA